MTSPIAIEFDRVGSAMTPHLTSNECGETLVTMNMRAYNETMNKIIRLEEQVVVLRNELRVELNNKEIWKMTLAELAK